MVVPTVFHSVELLGERWVEMMVEQLVELKVFLREQLMESSMVEMSEKW
jgi:hypothetical protein